ncbi:MAG: hypothetical protein ACTSQA_01125 [Candidatus Heimdallarchaeaceae archaeon]
MSKVIAFDIDNTLIKQDYKTGRDIPNYKLIEIYKFFQSQGCYMVIWSGSGQDYAKTWAEKLGLHYDAIFPKERRGDYMVDIAFDDQKVDLGKVNIKIRD